MGFTQVLKKRLRKAKGPRIGRDSSGIALFMVLASISVLALLVTDFTYIAQINEMIAFGGLDQAKAHYLAKSGLKLSLLRLKAFTQVKSMLNQLGGANSMTGVSKSVLNQIWSFPFMYPIPTNLPGINMNDKQAIDKFQQSTGLEGNFSAIIESESAKYNLNLLLPGFGTFPSPTPTPATTGQAPATSPTAQPAPMATPSYDPESARDSLYNYLNAIIVNKTENDPDFATNYSDFRLTDLVDNIACWEDRNYERRTSSDLDAVPMKRAPYYSLTELQMLPTMTDELYKLFESSLTVNTSNEININMMKADTLRGLAPSMTPLEIQAFFKFRDSTDVDNTFKTPDDFYKYLSTYVNAFKGNQQALNNFKAELIKRNIQLVVDDNQFKITVQAHVNNAVETIQAWVTMGAPVPTATNSSTPQNAAGTPPLTTPVGPGGQPTPRPNPGLKINYMRIF